MSNTDKTTTCDMREALVSYLYNEAAPDERRRVESHLAGCSACKEEMAAFESVRGMLQHWQVDELPAVRFVAATNQQSRRSALALLKELFVITPWWAKALGAAAAAMLVLAVLGTEVSIGRNGFSMRADLLRRGDAPGANLSVPQDQAGAEGQLTSADVRAIVNHMIAESERQQDEALRARLVSLESQLQSATAAEMAKLTARIQEYRARLKTLERDIDRREGIDLTDILFSELSSEAGERSNSGAQSGGQSGGE